jgi:hypothetical protein
VAVLAESELVAGAAAMWSVRGAPLLAPNREGAAGVTIDSPSLATPK